MRIRQSHRFSKLPVPGATRVEDLAAHAQAVVNGIGEDLLHLLLNLQGVAIRHDACFSPERSLAHLVEPTRVAHRTDMDRLVPDIATDGCITPCDALDLKRAVVQLPEGRASLGHCPAWHPQHPRGRAVTLA